MARRMSSFSPQSFLASAFSAASFFLEQFTPTVTRGGVADYRRYQKKLERIAAAADKRLYGRVKKRVDALAKENPPFAIEKQIVAIQVDLNAIMEKGVYAQHALLIEQIKKLDLLIEQFILEQRKKEDEIIILLMA